MELLAKFNLYYKITLAILLWKQLFDLKYCDSLKIAQQLLSENDEWMI
jgi:hypothetical protein